MSVNIAGRSQLRDGSGGVSLSSRCYTDGGALGLAGGVAADLGSCLAPQCHQAGAAHGSPARGTTGWARPAAAAAGLPGVCVQAPTPPQAPGGCGWYRRIAAASLAAVDECMQAAKGIATGREEGGEGRGWNRHKTAGAGRAHAAAVVQSKRTRMRGRHSTRTLHDALRAVMSSHAHPPSTQVKSHKRRTNAWPLAWRAAAWKLRPPRPWRPHRPARASAAGQQLLAAGAKQGACVNTARSTRGAQQGRGRSRQGVRGRPPQRRRLGASASTRRQLPCQRAPAC
jgi:hypothetical protein